MKLFQSSPADTQALGDHLSLEEKVLSPEQSANYYGNYTELLFSRLEDPVIQKQIFDFFESNRQWIEEHGTQMAKDYFPITREQFEKDFKEALAQEKNYTAIRFDLDLRDSYTGSINDPAREYPDMDYSNPKNRQAVIGVHASFQELQFTQDEVRLRSMLEAHEKGHVLRHFRSSGYLASLFSSAFDFSVDGIRPQSLFLAEFSDPSELVERMSQLKSYFGMKGHEVFTHKHLVYAREHYLEDGLDDNNMRDFFNAITPATEDAFISLINSVGT